MSTERKLQFDYFESLREISSSFSCFDRNYLIAHIKTLAKTPNRVGDGSVFKFDGLLMLLVLDGRISVELNLKEYTLGPNSFAVMSPGTMGKFLSVDLSNVEAYVFYATTEFMQTVNVNMAAIVSPRFIDKVSPAQDITKDESDLLIKYFYLLDIKARSKTNHRLESNIAASLLAAMFYQVVEMRYRHLNIEGAGRARACRTAYVHDFMKLVHVHYTTERSVSFYADKLFISPKYLSLLVKEMTGKSAARWIDEFVLMEAKNLLRFSGKNVQQVAYALNFSNQSSFGKYFKHLTGMSPTEFQKS